MICGLDIVNYGYRGLQESSSRLRKWLWGWIPSYLAVVEEICRQLSIRLQTIVAVVTPDLVEDRG